MSPAPFASVDIPPNEEIIQKTNGESKLVDQKKGSTVERVKNSINKQESEVLPIQKVQFGVTLLPPSKRSVLELHLPIYAENAGADDCRKNKFAEKVQSS